MQARRSICRNTSAKRSRPFCAPPRLRTLCDETARVFKQLTGYDRVMVYRFDDDGHGEVFSERREPELEAFLGNRYPASDIPQIARRLYVRNRVRVLVDVDYTPVPVLPARSPLNGAELDMSLCFLRSMSPIHIQYLKNMGVGATLVASLVVGGRLWGLVSCHHYAPRQIHYEARAVCELLAEIIATRIAALESFVQAQAELSVRRLEQRMVEAISRDGDWKAALFDSTQSISAAGRSDRRCAAVRGAGTDDRRCAGYRGAARDRSLARRETRRGGVVATASLGREESRFEVAEVSRERPARHAGVEGRGRISAVVSQRTDTHRDVGRQSIQAGDGRRRSRATCRRGARSRSGTSSSKARRNHGVTPMSRRRG